MYYGLAKSRILSKTQIVDCYFFIKYDQGSKQCFEITHFSPVGKYWVLLFPSYGIFWKDSILQNPPAHWALI